MIPHFRKYGLEYPRQEDNLYRETSCSYKRYGEEVHCYFGLEEGERFDVELEEMQGEHMILCAHFAVWAGGLQVGGITTPGSLLSYTAC